MQRTVEFTPGSERDLLRLQTPSRQRVSTVIAKLQDGPFAPGAEKLKGHEALWRLRVGDYRVIYALGQSTRTVTITRVRDRKEAYRDL
jgi:mRNA interferase RelE/StbE